ncbi:MAG: hypothetical protein R3F61_38235 [Myxococcota bacterium]
MYTRFARFFAVGVLIPAPLTALAAPDFDAGSDGSYGSLFVGASTSLEVPLPADGVIHATDVVVEAGGTLTFTPNANNTPVYLLSQGDIDIQGTIDVSGLEPTGTSGGIGGPGGFAGGVASPYQPGRRPSALNHDGNLLHLTGGLGGSGNNSFGSPRCGGGGGGGAILLASDTRITLDGTVAADGAQGTCPQTTQYSGGPGTPGSIRFVAPAVVGSGSLSLGGSGSATYVRIDSLHSEAGNWSVVGASTNVSLSEGQTMVARLPTVPAARIVSVGGQAVAQETGPVSVTIPGGSSRTQDVVIDVTGFGPAGTVQVRLEQQLSGGGAGVNTVRTATADLDLSTGTQVTIPVTFEPLTATWLDVVVRP